MNDFIPFYLMHNPIQNYAWGSITSINQLFDIPNPTNEPQAEIWMGAHPNGCSHIKIDGQMVRLDEFIAQNKTQVLGDKTEQVFNELPYLFKVLAAHKALSVQVHPSKAAAQAGFEKENCAGIDLKAAHRNYKDPNHKPELVYALTPYQAMNGFRDYQDIIANFSLLQTETLQQDIEALKATPNAQGLSHFFASILSLTGEKKDKALKALMAYSHKHQGEPLADLLIELEKQYPNDVGLFTPLMLHVITLEPGQAMYLDACTPHAYIKGTGLEIMANSDNVLRAGLTPKHMDVPELIANTRFEPKPNHEILLAPNTQGDAKHYPIPVTDFKFSVYQGNADIDCQSAEIIFAIDSDVTLKHEHHKLTLKKGQSAFVPYCTQSYQVETAGAVARAYC